jgi:hypothetical protein
MKYFNVLSFGLIFAFIVIFVSSVESKNIYALGVAELFGFAAIVCFRKANKKPVIS